MIFGARDAGGARIVIAPVWMSLYSPAHLAFLALLNNRKKLDRSAIPRNEVQPVTVARGLILLLLEK